MKLYELAFLISPDVKDEELNGYLEKVDNFIKEEGGVMVDSGRPTRIRLSYPIKSQSQAFLVFAIFQLEAEKIANLDKKMKADDTILRYLLINKKVVKETPRRVSRRYPLPVKEGSEKTKEEKVGLESIDEKLDEILGK
jgi:small subunit ribosomal protein S6